MFVVAISTMKLKDGASKRLTKDDYDAVITWMGTWTLKNNFKVALTETVEEGVQIIRDQFTQKVLPKWLSDRGVKSCYFEFTVRKQEVVDGMFWESGMANSVTYSF